MNLPYVIDNREHTLADVLTLLLRHDDVHALDVDAAPSMKRPCTWSRPSSVTCG